MFSTAAANLSHSVPAALGCRYSVMLVSTNAALLTVHLIDLKNISNLVPAQAYVVSAVF